VSAQARIYTTRELAELLTEHDEKHSRRRFGCDCDQKLIDATRELFARTLPLPAPIPQQPGLRPYVSPFARMGAGRRD
jgi:hypothetical protein